ncbi:PleD family two-component system response regulator [Candidatus Omnitrophota bacterium]
MAQKILIVDDDAEALRSAESILKTAGFEVVALNHPKFILKIVKNEKPDIILSDIIMPHQDGYALCKEIKELYNNAIPVLLCTNKTYEEDLIETAYKDFGADDFIIKPFKEDELLEKVKATIKKIGKSEDSKEKSGSVAKKTPEKKSIKKS